MDTVVLELKAIDAAIESSIEGLRRAAASGPVSSGLNLPPDSPLYENPGDHKFGKIAAWCDKNAT